MDKAPLSTLIRIGSRLRPQAFGWTMNEMGHTCALGAAYMAKFGKEPSASLTQCCRDLGIDCYNEVTEGIFYKNDVLMKSREEIADWLESQGL